MTAEELFMLPDDNLLHELVLGNLTTAPLNSARHGKIAARCGSNLAGYVWQQRLGECAVGVGFILARGPDTVRAADIAFVRKERDFDTPFYFPGPPDLAIEVLSPWDRDPEIREKVRDFLHAGTPMMIVIDPEERVASVHTPTATTHLGIDDAMDGGDVVPGWKLPLRELFE